MSKLNEPVVAGWFIIQGDRCRLLGTKCTSCGTVFFPRRDTFCANPYCTATKLEQIELSERGVIWSYTSVEYQPPEPFLADREAEWRPYVLLAVELEAEQIVVLGQAPPEVTVDDVQVGMPVRIAPGVLYADADTVVTTWNFVPECQEVAA